MYSSEATVSAYVRSISDGEERRGGKGSRGEDRDQTLRGFQTWELGEKHIHSSTW